MKKISDYLLYLRDCYEADNRGAVISNIFDRKVEKRYFFEQEELINGVVKWAQLKGSAAEELHMKAFMYRKEKELLYCSSFLVGVIKDGEGALQNICAPLFMYPAEIESGEGYPPGKWGSSGRGYAGIDRENIRINFGLINLLYPDSDQAIRIYDGIVNKTGLAGNILERNTIIDIASCVSSEDVSIDRSNFILFPVLASDRTLREELKALSQAKRFNHLKLCNAGALALVKKSRSTRGVLEELAAIAEEGDFSKPVKVLFGEESNKADWSFKVRKGRAPAILSHAQDNIIKSSRKNPLSLVIGPPGTGKSFTIASLALDHLSRGKSVLIASKMDHAVDVIGNIMESLIGEREAIVRGGDKKYLRELKGYTKHLLRGMEEYDIENTIKVRLMYHEIKRVEKKIKSLERIFTKRVKSEKKKGNFLYRFNRLAASPGRFLRRRYEKIISERETGPLLVNITDDLERGFDLRIKKIIEYINTRNSSNIGKTLRDYREELARFDEAIRARTDAKQEKLFSEIDFGHLLYTFPVWLVNSPGIFNVLPLEKELFDIAIIDEATQCDIASSLPILQRARRAVIVGDPNQLRHISFLSRYRQQVIGAGYNMTPKDIDKIDFREKSILDLTEGMIKRQKNIHLLNEHFRSLPQIISFSNDQFYNNALRIMTEKPQHTSGNAVGVIHCNGTRDKRGVNKIEAEEIIRRIGEIIFREKKFDVSMSQTIGVLSPFRDQVDYIYNRLTKNFPLEKLEKHNVLAGTAHTFQGEERDIMFLSLAVDNESHRNTFHFLSKEDVLNVAITRARVRQYVCVSINPQNIHRGLLIRRYLEHISAGTEPVEAEKDEHDIFVKEVSAALEGLGIKVFPAFEIAGMAIDLVMEYDNITCGIDLIGCPGVFEDSFSLERYRMYYRAGLTIIPLAYSSWFTKRDECIEMLKNKIGYLEEK